MDHPTDDYIVLVAHRGDWRNAPENSIQAIKNCLDMSVEIVEIDVRMSQNQHLGYSMILPLIVLLPERTW